MLFDDFQSLLRLVVVGTLAYVALIVVLRLSGKRTLAKMNAFDLVVTVSLGSTLATVLLTKNVALVEGVLAFSLLALLQFLVAWSLVRSRRLAKLVRASPRILLADGSFVEQALRDERVKEDEVLAAVRSAGIGDLGHVALVVLETDGSFSVISNVNAGARTTWPQEKPA